MSARPTVRIGLLAALLAGALVPGCGHEPVRPTLGEPRAEGLLVYQPPPGSRFDYVVYVPNAQRKMTERSERLKWVRTRMSNRCRIAGVADLYSHQAGTWPDGRVKVYFAVGVNCIPRLPPPTVELAPVP